ncbi:MAG: bifunctional diaminohydroxyphosphoribosylaminopyrimidine deaminase/5-amino-6-(5-phosphoribosylamino)uracil reductase RibD [Gemmatimonadota bacterium]|nr:bifunctional diaminohydroxyphosphoribosylaminopyrimidine deaminase/5-amino-6-(5-phosphoribosylamino)uracil reductase RibD [Gemmatimonadota bacterium]
MKRALTLAARGWGQTAPNPLVGAVIVRDGVVVGEGFHPRFGEPHAEALALAQAGDRARGADVYCTLEPCNGHGKQPPCAEALIAAGVRRVVASIADPNPAKAHGAERLRAAGISVEFGLEAAAARELNAPFLHWASGAERPWVTLKLAMSMDGAIAAADRERGWLTGEAARRHVHRLRASADAIAVGIGTALADDPALTVRGVKKPRVAPLRVVFDRHARLPVTSQLARTARRLPAAILTDDASAPGALELARRGVEPIVARDLATALRLLHDRGVRHLLVEGGAVLAGALLGANLVDRLVIFQAPVLLGAGALGAFSAVPSAATKAMAHWQVVERREFDADLMTVLAAPSPS